MHTKRKFRGGGYGLPDFSKIGFSWGTGADVVRWPGVAGVAGQSNYLMQSPVGIPVGGLDPARPSNGVGILKGGGRRRRMHTKRNRHSRRRTHTRPRARSHKRLMRGGFIPLEGVGRVWNNAIDGIKGVYNGFLGQRADLSSNPAIQPIGGNDVGGLAQSTTAANIKPSSEAAAATVNKTS